MNPASSNFTGIPAIAAAIQAQLNAVTLADNITKAFQRVELYDLELWIEAFMQRGISEQRIAIVVPGDPDWSEEFRVRRLMLRRTVPFFIFVSDRVLGDRVSALFGNASTPGALTLADRAMPYLAGQLISNPNGVISVVKSAAVLTVKNTDRQNLPGRAGVIIHLECKGGWMEAPLDVGPTL